jgi:hypothetical protein
VCGFGPDGRGSPTTRGFQENCLLGRRGLYDCLQKHNLSFSLFSRTRIWSSKQNKQELVWKSLSHSCDTRIGTHPLVAHSPVSCSSNILPRLHLRRRIRRVCIFVARIYHDCIDAGGGGEYISSVLHVHFDLHSNILKSFRIYLIRATRSPHRSFLHFTFMFTNVRVNKDEVPISRNMNHDTKWYGGAEA